MLLNTGACIDLTLQLEWSQWKREYIMRNIYTRFVVNEILIVGILLHLL